MTGSSSSITGCTIECPNELFCSNRVSHIFMSVIENFEGNVSGERFLTEGSYSDVIERHGSRLYPSESFQKL